MPTIDWVLLAFGKFTSGSVLAAFTCSLSADAACFFWLRKCVRIMLVMLVRVCFERVQVAGGGSAAVLAAANLADDDDMAQWNPDEDMAMTPGSMGGAPHADSLTLDTAFDISPQY